MTTSWARVRRPVVSRQRVGCGPTLRRTPHIGRPGTFDVTVERVEGRIGVLGSIPIPFSDDDIPEPSNGFAVLKDNGLLEFVLVFDKA